MKMNLKKLKFEDLRPGDYIGVKKDNGETEMIYAFNPVEIDIKGIKKTIKIEDIVNSRYGSAEYLKKNIAKSPIKTINRDNMEKDLKILEATFNPTYIEIFNKRDEERARKNAEKIQIKYDYLHKAFTELELKKELGDLEEINTLLFCEAETLLNKIYNRINKKANAKNIRIARKLAELKNENYIECT